jgi:hypothetical protein
VIAENCACLGTQGYCRAGNNKVKPTLQHIRRDRTQALKLIGLT